MSQNPEPTGDKCLCQVRHVQAVAIVDLAGSLTLDGGAGKVRSEVGALLDEGSRRILVNCAGITHVDSAGVGELVSSHSAAARQGSILKLACVHDRLETLMKLTGLDTMIDCFPDEKTALDSFDDAKPA
jgi:anti-sigma B factor antagonist